MVQQCTLPFSGCLMQRVDIGEHVLFLGDCLDMTFDDFEIDAVVTDPPYGGGYQVNKKRSRQTGLKAIEHDHDANWPEMDDSKPFDPSPWLGFGQIVIWGANHYASRLPDAKCWLVWDKKAGTTPDNFSDCELAWTNLKGPVRMFTHLWRGLVRAGEENCRNGPKLHPWQKPLNLMRWCVSMTQGTVLDPYMGSGTTGVAVVEAGRRFIGVEQDPTHFETAVKRIEGAAYNRQGQLL